MGFGTSADKACQLAIKLLGDYLAASCALHGVGPEAWQRFGHVDREGAPTVATTTTTTPEPPSARTQALPCVGGGEGGAVLMLAGWWQEALTILVPSATGPTSYMVRAAALGALMDLSQPVFTRLPGEARTQVVMVASAAACSDSAAAVRAAGCKVLGALAGLPSLLCSAELVGVLIEAVQTGLQDSVLSVRIASCWALANLCEAWPAAAARSSQPQQQQAPPPAHLRQLLPAMCTCAVSAAQGEADKVRTHGVRAVGTLLGCLTPSLAEAAGMQLDRCVDVLFCSVLACLRRQL